VDQFGLRQRRHVSLALEFADGYLMEFGQYFAEQGVHHGLVALHEQVQTFC
jgi:hypothetical protein